MQGRRTVEVSRQKRHFVKVIKWLMCRNLPTHSKHLTGTGTSDSRLGQVEFRLIHTGPIATNFPNLSLNNSSPDKSELLVGSFTGTEFEQAMWSLWCATILSALEVPNVSSDSCTQ